MEDYDDDGEASVVFHSHLQMLKALSLLYRRRAVSFVVLNKKNLSLKLFNGKF